MEVRNFEQRFWSLKDNVRSLKRLLIVAIAFLFLAQGGVGASLVVQGGTKRFSFGVSSRYLDHLKRP